MRASPRAGSARRPRRRRCGPVRASQARAPAAAAAAPAAECRQGRVCGMRRSKSNTPCTASATSAAAAPHATRRPGAALARPAARSSAPRPHNTSSSPARPVSASVSRYSLSACSTRRAPFACFTRGKASWNAPSPWPTSGLAPARRSASRAVARRNSAPVRETSRSRAAGGASATRVAPSSTVIAPATQPRARPARGEDARERESSSHARHPAPAASASAPPRESEASTASAIASAATRRQHDTRCAAPGRRVDGAPATPGPRGRTRSPAVSSAAERGPAREVVLVHERAEGRDRGHAHPPVEQRRRSGRGPRSRTR